MCVGLSLVRLGYVICLSTIHVWPLAGGGHFEVSAIWDIWMEAGGKAFVGDNLELVVYQQLSENLENSSQMLR